MLSASDSGCIQSSSRAMVSEQSTSNQPRATVATEAKGKGEGIAPLNPTIFTIGLSIGGIKAGAKGLLERQSQTKRFTGARCSGNNAIL